MNTQTTKNELVADWRSLMRIFINPEDDAAKTTLNKYMEQIMFGLHDFLNAHVGITEEINLKKLADRFKDTRLSENPEKKLTEVITDIMQEIAPRAVNVTSPFFIGHMTSAIPFFMVHLKTIVAALNQNVVKLETSKVLSVLEKQVIAKIHRLVFQEGDEFYDQHVQNTETTLGAFTSGGTSANMTALWVARNKAFPPKGDFLGVETDGIAEAYEAHGVKRSVVLISGRGHYSFRKAGGMLGIGNKNILAVNVDRHSRMDMNHLNETIEELTKDPGTRILAVVGIAGTTETGNIDPLKQIGTLCREKGIYFHVDAAWGGPVLTSDRHKHLLSGIEMANSVTIDGHKQFYMPMSCGMVYFRDPQDMDAITYHANYINRKESVDLGKKSLSGSREANSLILDSALKIMGTKGYALLINHGIETARRFAEEIKRRPLFQLVTAPELNILTYRICPQHLRSKMNTDSEYERKQINRHLNEINITVQRLQRESGKSFVSRTTLACPGVSGEKMVVLRCVLMNPMTNMDILNIILDEQEKIYRGLV